MENNKARNYRVHAAREEEQRATVGHRRGEERRCVAAQWSRIAIDCLLDTRNALAIFVILGYLHVPMRAAPACVRAKGEGARCIISPGLSIAARELHLRAVRKTKDKTHRSLILCWERETLQCTSTADE